MTENQHDTLEALLEALSWVLRTGTAQQYSDLRDFYDKQATHFQQQQGNQL